jgi:methyl-accepting chemotaxis protein
MQVLKQLKISAKLTLGFALVAAIVVIVGVIGMADVAKVNDMLNTMYDDNLIPITMVAKANVRALEHNRALDVYVIESEKTKMDELGRTMTEFEEKLHERLDTYRKTTLSEKEAELLKAFDAAWPIYLQNAKEVMAFSYEGNNKDAIALMRGKAGASFEKAHEVLWQLIEVNADLAKKADESSNAFAASIKVMMASTIVVGFVVAMILGILISRAITIPLKKAVEVSERIAGGDLTVQVEASSKDETGQLLAAMKKMLQSLSQAIGTVRSGAADVASAATQLSATTVQVSEASKAQSDAASSTASAVEEVTVSINSVAHNAEEAHQLANASLEQTEASTQSMQQLVLEIQKVESSVNQIAASVHEFVNSTQTITSMTKQVKDIAEQTNLLALNAAIEAARAGEQGRGFAVVADEVRKLAEKSGQSASEIDAVTQKLGGQSEAVEKAIGLGLESLGSSREHVGTVVKVLGQAKSSVAAAAKGVQEISGSVKEQSTASNDIAKNVEKIAQMTEENHAAVDEAAKAAANLQSLADGLRVAVSQFKTA